MDAATTTDPAPGDGLLLLTERQAAERLNISPRTLWSLRKAGQIKYVGVGVNGVRYTPADLVEWIERNRRSATQKG